MFQTLSFVSLVNNWYNPLLLTRKGKCNSLKFSRKWYQFVVLEIQKYVLRHIYAAFLHSEKLIRLVRVVLTLYTKRACENYKKWDSCVYWDWLLICYWKCQVNFLQQFLFLSQGNIDMKVDRILLQSVSVGIKLNFPTKATKYRCVFYTRYTHSVWKYDIKLPRRSLVIFLVLLWLFKPTSLFNT